MGSNDEEEYDGVWGLKRSQALYFHSSPVHSRPIHAVLRHSTINNTCSRYNVVKQPARRYTNIWISRIQVTGKAHPMTFTSRHRRKNPTHSQRGIRRSLVVSSTLRPLYSREEPGTNCRGDWVGLGADLDGTKKISHHRLRSPDRLASSESLYDCVIPAATIPNDTTLNKTRLESHKYFLALHDSGSSTTALETQVSAAVLLLARFPVRWWVAYSWNPLEYAHAWKYSNRKN